MYEDHNNVHILWWKIYRCNGPPVRPLQCRRVAWLVWCVTCAYVWIFIILSKLMYIIQIAMALPFFSLVCLRSNILITLFRRNFAGRRHNTGHENNKIIQARIFLPSFLAHTHMWRGTCIEIILILIFFPTKSFVLALSVFLSFLASC